MKRLDSWLDAETEVVQNEDVASTANSTANSKPMGLQILKKDSWLDEEDIVMKQPGWAMSLQIQAACLQLGGRV